jgi:alpha-aminoadipate/glutamate carrier protein LysW
MQREKHNSLRRNDVMANAECPECAGQIPLAANTEIGEILSCPDCGSRLEVKSVSPPSLQPAPKVEEDWGE